MKAHDVDGASGGATMPPRATRPGTSPFPTLTPWERRILLLILPALLAVTVTAALLGFAVYDDEGWLINGAQLLVEGARPYGELVSNVYGPLHHGQTALLAWAFGPSHTAFRVATALLAWSTAVVLYFLLRRVLPPLPAAAGAFAWWANSLKWLHEALHPGWSTTLLLVLMAYQVVAWVEDRRPRRLVLAGALCGLMLGFKANLPVFAALAAGGIVLTHGGAARWAAGAWAALVAATLLAILGPNLVESQHWISLAYWTLLVGCASACLAPRPPRSTAAIALGSGRSARELGLLVGGGLLGTLGWLLPLLLWIDLAEWLRATLSSSRFLGYSVPITNTWTAPAMAAGLAVVLAVAHRRPWAPWALLAGSVLAGATFLWAMNATWPPAYPSGTALASVLAVAVARGAGVSTGARALAGFALLQLFQAFPIPGVQQIQGMILVPAMIVLAFSAAIDELVRGHWKGRLTRAGSLALVVPCSLIPVQLVLTYLSTPWLGLPGTVGIRAANAPQLRAVVAAIHEHSPPDAPLFTYPGMASFYLWTGRRALIPYHFPDWWRVSSPEQLVRALAELPEVSVIVVAPGIVAFFDAWDGGRVQHSELRTALHREYVPSLEAGRWELWKRRTTVTSPAGTD